MQRRISAIVSRIIPNFSISLTFKWPDENTIAFGGVATGSIKAREAEIVAEMSKIIGFVF